MELVVLISFLIFFFKSFGYSRFKYETERAEYWRQHHGIWPPNWHNESKSFLQVQASREAEVMKLTGYRERWENWMQVSFDFQIFLEFVIKSDYVLF
jgi:hypothetical protein